MADGMIILPPAGDVGPQIIPAIPPRYSFGQSLQDLSQVPQIRFGDTLPGSQDEARRRAITSHAGSAAQTHTTINLRLMKFDEYPTHREIFAGQLIFALVGHAPVVNNLPILNLRHVNRYLASSYSIGMKLLNDRNLRERFFSLEEFVTLTQTPTHLWGRLDFLNKLFADPSMKEAHYLRSVFEEGMRDRLNLLGYVQGQQNEDMTSIDLAVGAKGMLHNVENIFGNAVAGQDRLYLIYRRTWNPKTREWGPFAYIPWFGISAPTETDLMYVDITGCLAKGQAIYLGHHIEWNENVVIDETTLHESIGLKEAEYHSHYTKRPEPGCLNVVLQHNGLTKHPWLC